MMPFAFAFVFAFASRLQNEISDVKKNTKINDQPCISKIQKTFDQLFYFMYIDKTNYKNTNCCEKIE